MCVQCRSACAILFIVTFLPDLYMQAHTLEMFCPSRYQLSFVNMALMVVGPQFSTPLVCWLPWLCCTCSLLITAN